MEAVNEAVKLIAQVLENLIVLDFYTEKDESIMMLRSSIDKLTEVPHGTS